MSNKINFQKELDSLINEIKDNPIMPVLVLHGCCAPCSSYCLEYLSEFFDIKLLFFNPNISSEEEYNKRLAEVHRFVGEFLNSFCGGDNFANYTKRSIQVIDGRYDSREFFDAVKGFEKCEEGGDRCRICYELRMREAAVLAKEINADYFTTTLSISPLKKSDVINEIGQKLSLEYGVKHLPSDFKKKEGYKRSIQLSKEHNLYRQDYCGCVFSKSE